MDGGAGTTRTRELGQGDDQLHLAREASHASTGAGQNRQRPVTLRELARRATISKLSPHKYLARVAA